MRGLYEQLRLPARLREDKIELLYSLADVLPLGFKGIHLLALRNPTLYTSTKLDWPRTEKARIATLRQLATRSVGRADHILFVSEDSRRWISERLHIPLERSSTIYHGIGKAFFDENQATLPSSLARPWDEDPYVLSVSTIYRYKNYIRLVEAFDIARANTPMPHHLVIVGRAVDREYADRLRRRVAQSAYAKQMHVLGEVSYEALPALYRGAAAKIFPSYLETFGHPILEAMASGVPVAAAEIGVFRELARDAALYFDPHKADEMASAILDPLRDSPSSSSRVERGLSRARDFTWERCARELHTLIDGLLSRH